VSEGFTPQCTAEVRSKKDELRKISFGAFQNCHENRDQFPAFMTDRLKTFRSNKIGFREQIRPISCFFDFSQTIVIDINDANAKRLGR